MWECHAVWIYYDLLFQYNDTKTEWSAACIFFLSCNKAHYKTMQNDNKSFIEVECELWKMNKL